LPNHFAAEKRPVRAYRST